MRRNGWIVEAAFMTSDRSNMQASKSPSPVWFDVPYGRPEQFSDPYDDFTPELLEEMLGTPDNQLLWHHYCNILGPFLPAGTYEEGVYFLPRAFQFTLLHEDHALDLITPLVWFISEHAESLKRDGLLTKARESLFACFSHWTSEFIVEHFDRAACKAKGWGRETFDLVKHCEVVCQGTCDLVEFQRHADIAEDFANGLAHHESDPVKAAWFLEYARAKDDVSHPPFHPPIQQLISDRDKLQSAAAVVRETIAKREKSPTYWENTFKALGI
jgi:hypothetical protein